MTEGMMDEADGVWMGEDTRGVQALAKEHRADHRGDLRRALGLSCRCRRSLARLAERLYGKGNVAKVRWAWKAFSDGFANYPLSCQTIYNGPHQWGPANPLYLHKTGYGSTMVGIPYDDLDGWRKNYPRETYAELIGKVADGFAEGCRLLEGVAERRELDMFRAEQMHFASCRDQALFIMARDSGDRDAMRRLAKAELERAKAYWPLVRADSRIGYESSNHYFFTPRDVLEKVLSCRAILK